MDMEELNEYFSDPHNEQATITRDDYAEMYAEMKRKEFLNGTTIKCECGCGSNAQIVHTDLLGNHRYLLCANCNIPFVMTALSPDQFFAMLKNGHTTEEFMLHSDFYDEDTGEAMQPKI